MKDSEFLVKGQNLMELNYIWLMPFVKNVANKKIDFNALTP